MFCVLKTLFCSVFKIVENKLIIDTRIAIFLFRQTHVSITKD